MRIYNIFWLAIIIAGLTGAEDNESETEVTAESLAEAPLGEPNIDLEETGSVLKNAVFGGIGTEDQPSCPFLDRPVERKTDPFFEDCGAYMSSKSSILENRNGVSYLTTKGTYHVGKGQTICFKDGTSKVTNEEGETTKVSNNGFKLKLLEIRHSFPVSKKVCRKQGLHFEDPEDYYFNWGGIERWYNDLDTSSSSKQVCGHRARGFKYKTYLYWARWAVEWVCFIPDDDDVDLVRFSNDYIESYLFEVAFRKSDGTIEYENFAVGNGINQQPFRMLGNDSVKIGYTSPMKGFQNPLSNQDKVIHKGIIYEPLDSNTVDTIERKKRFSMSCEFDRSKVLENSGYDNCHDGTVKDLSKSSFHSLYENVEISYDEDRNFLVQGVNYVRNLPVNVVVDSELGIGEIYRSDGIIDNFECKQEGIYITCEITSVSQKGLARLNLFSQIGGCQPIDSQAGNAIVGEKFTLSVTLVIKGDNKVKMWICTLYGICRTVEATMEDNSEQIDIEPKSDVNVGVIIGIVLTVAFVIAIASFWIRRSKKRNQSRFSSKITEEKVHLQETITK